MQGGKLSKELTIRLRAILGEYRPRTFTRLIDVLANNIESLHAELEDTQSALARANNDGQHALELLQAAERQRDELREKSERAPENGRVTAVTVGTGAHDGRGFFSLSLEFDMGAQGVHVPWTSESATMINGIIRVCGARDLLDCKGKYVRALRNGGRSFPIIGLAHIVDLHNCIHFTPDAIEY